MVIVENNLSQLASQYNLCDVSLVDEFSLKIRLGAKFHRPRPESGTVTYGVPRDPLELFGGCETASQNLTLQPGDRIIGCSQEIYKMPLDYLGIIQTKGTLARFFVMVTCNDGQVEPGFNGFITLEIVNLSPWTIDIPVGSEVAQVYIFKCSSSVVKGYAGRYSESALVGPTLPIFKY